MHIIGNDTSIPNKGTSTTSSKQRTFLAHSWHSRIYDTFLIRSSANIQHVINGNCSIYHLRFQWPIENLISKRGRPEMGISHVNCGNALLYMVEWEGGPRPLNRIWQALVQNFCHTSPLSIIYLLFSIPSCELHHYLLLPFCKESYPF